jgi:hypothetical protein
MRRGSRLERHSRPATGVASLKLSAHAASTSFKFMPEAAQAPRTPKPRQEEIYPETTFSLSYPVDWLTFRPTMRVLLLLPPALAAGAFRALPPVLQATPISMDRVTLSPESRFFVQRARDADQLLAFNLTDLMCEYTSAANLTGTWANPTCTKLEGVQYWGHYLGHFLSATAQLVNSTASVEARVAGATVVATMTRVQALWTALGPPYVGYLFPYTYDAWENLWAGESCAPVCVPWYIYHKMLAGLLCMSMGRTRACR